MPVGSEISGGERAVWTGGGRAAHYREKEAPFKELASVELQPRVRAQLLGLAAEYDQLADAKPGKPSASSWRGTRTRNEQGSSIVAGQQ